jgi:uncharacterized protein YoxC
MVDFVALIIFAVAFVVFMIAMWKVIMGISDVKKS